jgi:hypothetical protein
MKFLTCTEDFLLNAFEEEDSFVVKQKLWKACMFFSGRIVVAGGFRGFCNFATTTAVAVGGKGKYRSFSKFLFAVYN